MGKFTKVIPIECLAEEEKYKGEDICSLFGGKYYRSASNKLR